MATAEADWAWLRPDESDEVARWRNAVRLLGRTVLPPTRRHTPDGACPTRS